MQGKCILCPVDFSDLSSAAYQHAVSLAEHYKAMMVTLYVVESWKYPVADYAGNEADSAKFCREMNEGDEVRLQRFVKRYSAGRTQPKLVIYQGNAPDSILSFARTENIGVTVKGTHGRGGVDLLVLPLATRVMREEECRVIQLSPCPVLAVHT